MPMVRNSTRKPNWLKIGLEAASLSTPRGRLVSFGSVLVVLVILPTEKLYLVPIRSIYETVFHFVPYSSGMTRGVSSLLHLHFAKAYEYNPLSYAVIIMVIFLITTDIVRLVREQKR